MQPTLVLLWRKYKTISFLMVCLLGLIYVSRTIIEANTNMGLSVDVPIINQEEDQEQEEQEEQEQEEQEQEEQEQEQEEQEQEQDITSCNKLFNLYYDLNKNLNENYILK